MNALENIITILKTPVAKRKGVTISAEDCAIWAEELEKYNDYVKIALKQCYDATNRLLNPL
jgi:hypothetical protein